MVENNDSLYKIAMTIVKKSTSGSFVVHEVLWQMYAVTVVIAAFGLPFFPHVTSAQLMREQSFHLDSCRDKLLLQSLTDF